MGYRLLLARFLIAEVLKGLGFSQAVLQSNKILNLLPLSRLSAREWKE
jgi:hypothetical protein